MIERNSTNTCIHASPSLLLKYSEPQPLPITPIGIMAYTFAFLRDNLCQNSSLQLFRERLSYKLKSKSERDNDESYYMRNGGFTPD